MFMHGLNCPAQARVTESHQNSAIYQVRIHCRSDKQHKEIFEQSIDGSLVA
jgi:hypothetical protein